MEPKPDCPEWNLQLREASPHDVERSEFRRRVDAAPHVVLGSAIQKRPGVRALLCWLIELKIRRLQGDPNSLWQGPQGSPVATLVMALAQAGKPEGTRLGWPVKLCGEWNHRPIILDLFKCQHLGKGTSNELFVVDRGKVQILGENVHVFFGKRKVTGLDELQVLAEELV